MSEFPGMVAGAAMLNNLMRQAQRGGAIEDTANGAASVAAMYSPGLLIREQPQSIVVPEGATAVFSVNADGVQAYQWEYSLDDVAWYVSPLAGYDTPTLRVPGTAYRNGLMYRCLLQGYEVSLYTNPAVLTVLS